MALLFLGEKPELTVMVTNQGSPIGLVAGNGDLPLEFAKTAKLKNIPLIVIAHHGETDRQIESFVEQCYWVKAGEIGKVINNLRKAGVKQVTFAGGLNRVSLFGDLKLDFTAVKILSTLHTHSDDRVLRAVAAEFERSGMEVFSAAKFLRESLELEGTLTKRKLDAMQCRDAEIGIKAARLIGAADIGQTIVVNRGTVIAVEAVEGTDAAIRRAGILGGPGAVVIKFSKPSQDLRFDLPTVGVQTLESMSTAAAAALVLEKGNCFILKQAEFIEAANQMEIAVRIVSGVEDL